MSFQSRFELPELPEDVLDGDELKIIHIDRQRKVGLVKSDNMKKSLRVTLQDWLIDGIMLFDYVKLNKSGVTGEYIVTDYYVNVEVSAAIHNSYQTNYDDMICDERGVPYGE